LLAAKENLRHCFDYPSRETLAALCTVALASYYIDPRGTFYKYASFASIIFSELKRSLTVLEQRQTWTAMELVRAYVMNDRACSFDAAVSEGMNYEAPACALADADWRDCGMLGNSVLNIFFQLERTVSHLREANSDTQTRSQSLLSLRDTCVQAQITGDSNPVLQKMLWSSLLFVYVHMNQLDAAAEAANLCVRAFETFPMLLIWTRKLSSIHALLDVAELLADDRLEGRIASVRRAVPDTDMVTDAYDIEEIVHMSTRDQLMKQLPVHTAQQHPNSPQIEIFEDLAGIHALDVKDVDDVLQLLDTGCWV
jgi:hypothetical protein